MFIPRAHRLWASTGKVLGGVIHMVSKAGTCVTSARNLCSQSWSPSKESSEIIFKANNAKRKPDQIDLHGLPVSDALEFSLSAIKDARKRGSKQIRFIVGKGLHSPDGLPKIKPALQGYLSSRGIRNEIDPQNDGVLVVYLD
ncbi:hypothetical protein BV22DRAFT_333267 [Leucogyrophana mollusca]|uniref:Uncharacterized protein n=1 Tax=Leucogyrophana mollusca TaxID=85980 RepID=A0ACB8BLI5_9AGAM|nr:hypothetical protein BV22DRAFT_333267 [Leucogyrophana mollusca]